MRGAQISISHYSLRNTHFAIRNTQYSILINPQVVCVCVWRRGRQVERNDGYHGSTGGCVGGRCGSWRRGGGRSCAAAAAATRSEHRHGHRLAEHFLCFSLPAGAGGGGCLSQHLPSLLGSITSLQSQSQSQSPSQSQLQASTRHSYTHIAHFCIIQNR